MTHFLPKTAVWDWVSTRDKQENFGSTDSDLFKLLWNHTLLLNL